MTVREVPTADPPCCVRAGRLRGVADRLAGSGGEIPTVADPSAEALVRPPVTAGRDREALAAGAAVGTPTRAGLAPPTA